MIKNRMIQKRIKGKVLAVAMTAVMASLFVPMVGNAADAMLATKEETACTHVPSSTFTSDLILEGDYSYRWADGGNAGGSCKVNGKCGGHKITGNLSNSIRVNGGDHRIVLEGAEIKPTGTDNASYSPIHITGGSVTLVVEGTKDKPNVLTGPNGRAGIYVAAPDAALTIKSTSDENVLKVKGGTNGAGIGGYGGGGTTASAGTITIQSGTIVAEGGNQGAGIGASGWGTTQQITINGGNVTAKGGDGIQNTKPDDPNLKVSLGAPGIGDGNDDRIKEGGKITINGGNIVAIGGNNYTDTSSGASPTNAAGLSADQLTSTEGRTVIISDRLNIRKNNGFCGLQWNLERDEITGAIKGGDGFSINVDDFINSVYTKGVKHGDTCTVNGKAELPSDFTLKADENLIVPEGATLRIPNEVTIADTAYVQLNDRVTVVNPDNLIGGNVSYGDNINYKVSFDPQKDLKMNTLEKDEEGKWTFPYIAEEYKGTPMMSNDLFSIQGTRDRVYYNGAYHDGCPVDIDSSTKHTFEVKKSNSSGVSWEAVGEKGVTDAGDYKVKFSCAGNPELAFKIKPYDISQGGIEVSAIPDKEYRGTPFIDTDFEGQVTIKYNGHTIEDADYYLEPGGQSDAGPVKMTINGKRNLTGTYDKASFNITPVVLTDDDTVVLKTSNLNVTTTDGADEKAWNPTYSGNAQEPTVERCIVNTKSGGTIELSRYDVKWERITKEGEGCIDAGTIKVTVTPKKDNGNFTGSCSKDFIIHPKILKASMVTPAYKERPYDGSDKVAIKKVEVDLDLLGENKDVIGERPADFDGVLVRVPTEAEIAEQSMSGSLGSADVGTYSTVTLGEDVRLAGAKGINYTIAGDYTYSETGGTLANKVEIKQAPAPGYTVITRADPDAVPLKFNCILTFTANQGSAFDAGQPIYYYRSEGGDDKPTKESDEWVEGTLNELNELACDSMGSNSETFVYIYTKGTPNVMEGEITGPYSVKSPGYPLEDGPPEDICKVTPEQVEEDGEAVYKLTVEPYIKADDEYPLGHYKYSLSLEPDAVWQYEPEFYVEPKKTYTVYIKYAEGGGYAESTNATAVEVTTGAGKAKNPEITCNNTVPNEAGEISASGTANVTIEYTGKVITNPDIYYTINGSDPSVGSTLYTGAFELKESDFKDGRAIIKAIAIKSDVASSDVTTVTVIKGSNPLNPNDPNSSSGIDVELERLTKETTPNLIANTELPGKGIDSFDAVTQPLASEILPKRGYENENITYADLRIKIKGTDRYATDDDFKNAEGGVLRVTLTMDQLRSVGFPANYDGTTHNFAVSHMFASNIQRLGIEAGQSELLNVSKSSDGKTISFDLRGTSPVAFGWADVNNSDANPIQDPEDPTNPTDPEEPTEPTDPTDPENPTIDVDGEPRSADADGGTTTDTDVGTQGASNDAANALSDIMPKTGDPLSFVPWIAAAVVSVGAIVFFATRKGGKKKKKQTVKKTQAAKKKK